MALLIAFLISFQPGDWQTYTNRNYIFDICGNDSTLNLATAGGVVVLQKKPGPPTVKRSFVHTDGLGVNRCLAIAGDSRGNVWVGTDGAGLVVIPAESTRAVSYRRDELPLRIQRLLIDRDRVLLGTDEGMFVVDTRGTPLNFSDDRIRRFVAELPSNRVLSLLSWTSGGYWVGTNRGITFSDTGFTHWRTIRRPLGDSARAMGLLPDRRLVVATEAGCAIGDTLGFQPLLVFPVARRVNALVVCGWDIYLATEDTLFKLDTSGAVSPVLVTKPVSLWADEALWVGCGGSEEAGWGLLYQRSGSTWEGVGLGGIVSGSISDCQFGRDGSVYLGHHGSWVTRILPDGGIRAISSPLPWVVQIRCDSRGRLWFSHFSYEGGVSVYDPEADTWGVVRWGSSSAMNVIQAFGLDRFDTKWVYNLAGLVVAIDSVGRRQEFALPELAPPPDGSYEFAFDSRNRVWLGLTNGLEELDYGGTLFEPADDFHQLHTTGLPSLQVRSVAVDPQDRVWVATPQGGAVWDGSSFKVYNTQNSPLLSNNLVRVRVDQTGRVWFLSDRGLSIFDVATARWINYTPQNSGMIPDPQGLANFYTALELDDSRGCAGIGSARGFSLFDFKIPSDTTSVGLRIYPNPCILGLHRGVVVEGLPSDARVRIFTPSGQLLANLTVSSGTGRTVWYPERVSSGLYVLVAQSGQGVKVERFVVISPCAPTP